jgi:hypothetical protein
MPLSGERVNLGKVTSDSVTVHSLAFVPSQAPSWPNANSDAKSLELLFLFLYCTNLNQLQSTPLCIGIILGFVYLVNSSGVDDG